MKVMLLESEWQIVFTGLAYLAGQHSRAGDMASADKARHAYNEIARQTRLRTGLPVYDRSEKL